MFGMLIAKEGLPLIPSISCSLPYLSHQHWFKPIEYQQHGLKAKLDELAGVTAVGGPAGEVIAASESQQMPATILPSYFSFAKAQFSLFFYERWLDWLRFPDATDNSSDITGKENKKEPTSQWKD